MFGIISTYKTETHQKDYMLLPTFRTECFTYTTEYTDRISCDLLVLLTLVLLNDNSNQFSCFEMCIILWKTLRDCMYYVTWSVLELFIVPGFLQGSAEKCHSR